MTLAFEHGGQENPRRGHTETGLAANSKAGMEDGTDRRSAIDINHAITSSATKRCSDAIR
jgi:hypothetical protein